MFLDIPGAPQGPLMPSDVSRDSLTLSWKPPKDDGGSPLTNYIIDKLDSQFGGWVRAARPSASTTSCPLSGLIVGHEYNFRVYAENRYGVSEPIDLDKPVKAKSPIGKHETVTGSGG